MSATATLCRCDNTAMLSGISEVCLCHRKCNGRVKMGRAGRHGTQSGNRRLSGWTCGLYEQNRKFSETIDPVFKTSNDIGAKDHRL
jgi:hypothetical protein